MMNIHVLSTFFKNDTFILFCSSGVNIKIPINSAGVDNVTVQPAKGIVAHEILNLHCHSKIWGRYDFLKEISH